MNYKTKFNFNDLVWKITHLHKEKFTKCPFCEGTGNIKCNNIERSCPACYGQKGTREWIGKKWMVEDMLTIGEIRIKHTAPAKYKEEYMCYETGVGSGTIHSSINLFFIKKEAEKECNKRNKEQDE